MSKKVGFALLAAGKGTRLKIDTPKALCPALGITLIDHVLNAINQFVSEHSISAEISIIVGHKKEEIIKHLSQRNSGLNFVWQKEQKGTGDALRAYFSERPQNANLEYTFIVCADTPLITAQSFSSLWEHVGSAHHRAAAATFEASTPYGYGRIVRGDKGFEIVEEKDATLEQKKITEVNSGFYLAETSYLTSKLSQIDNNNKSGEFYLTDIFKVNENVLPVKFPSAEEFIGVNTLEQLDEATQVLRKRKLTSLMLSGVTCFDSRSIWVDQQAHVESGAVLYPGVAIYGNSSIGKGVVIENGSLIRNSTIESGSHILPYCHIEEAIVHSEAQIGPFARLRPGSDIGENSKIGNFVEVKKSKLHAGVKVSHLSYVGDAEIGEESNIGCGFITCNYDGRDKHKTKIGRHVFIGSDVQVVAPIQIGDTSFVAAGSTVTKDVPAGGFAIARSQQVTKDGMASKFLKTKKPS
jgi:bifunctional UDP-N-acetylglucosamine pyrophosphorylase/glucosamine-1-phosphate N-acetyltransferase